MKGILVGMPCIDCGIVIHGSLEVNIDTVASFCSVSLMPFVSKKTAGCLFRKVIPKIFVLLFGSHLHDAMPRCVSWSDSRHATCGSPVVSALFEDEHTDEHKPINVKV